MAEIKKKSDVCWRNVVSLAWAHFNSQRHHHRSGWCGDAAAVHGTCKRHPGDLVDNQHHYGQAPPWPALEVCTPHVQALKECIKCFTRCNISTALQFIKQLSTGLTSCCWGTPHVTRMPVCWGVVRWGSSPRRPKQLVSLSCFRQQTLV